ncbi:MAG: Prolyl tripeptidyl peptidase precursor [Verrucomicrobiota bacterium]
MMQSIRTLLLSAGLVPALSWLAVTGLAATAGAAEPAAGPGRRLTAEAITRPEPASLTNLSRAQWRPGTAEVSFLRPVVREGRTNAALWVHDVDTGRAEVLLEATVLPEKARGALGGYSWFPDGRALLLVSERNLHRVEVPGGRMTALTRDAAEEELPVIAPDGRRVAFVRSNDLHVVEVASGRVTRLTRDGSRTRLNGRLDWVYDEEFRTMTGSPRAFEWSPDSRWLVFLSLDQATVPEHPITDFVAVHPRVTRQHYPKSGDSNAVPAVGVVAAGGCVG